MSNYYFETEKHGALWFAFVWREGESPEENPPVKTFYARDDTDERVTWRAVRWILEQQDQTRYALLDPEDSG